LARLEDFMLTYLERPVTAALAGVLSLLPFVMANAIVSQRVEPFFSLIRPGTETSVQEMVLLAFVLLLMPVGAYVALRPVLRMGFDRRRSFLFLNVATAAVVLVVFGTIAIALGNEIYRCEILQLPNCD
jgi:multisubunit Na+/H+ antiporter MnhG subunit